jgi:hypothetical protein
MAMIRAESIDMAEKRKTDIEMVAGIRMHLVGGKPLRKLTEMLYSLVWTRN